MSQFTADTMGANFGQLEGTHAALQAQIAKFNALLDEAKAIVRPLAAQWTGEASAAYQVQQNKWDTSAADLNMVLARINGALADTNSGFRRTDQSNADLFRS